MNTENEKAVRDPIAEAIDLLEKSAEPFDKACMLLRAALQSQSNTPQDGGEQAVAWRGMDSAPKALMPSAETLEHASHATIESPFNACRHKDYCGELRRKAMAQQQVSNTDGWKLVPVEPTQGMHDSWMYGKGPWSERYCAMLAAAPQPPAEDAKPEQQEQSGEAVNPAKVANIVRNFHRNSCYPEAMGAEVDSAVDAIMRLIANATPTATASQEPSGEAVSAADAFELGFQFANALRSPMSRETRHIARIMTADFWPAGFSECAKGIDYTGTASAAIVHVKRNIISKLSTFPATPTSTAIAAMVIKQAADIVVDRAHTPYAKNWDEVAETIRNLLPANAEAELVKLILKVINEAQEYTEEGIRRVLDGEGK
jgi:hypothetical protein